jgi:hypothetical protein
MLRSLLPLAALLASAPSRASTVAVVTPLQDRLPPGRLELVERSVCRALALDRGFTVIPPGESFARLARESALLTSRRRAADLLAAAVTLVEQMRYREALRQLDAAHSAAEAGLARVVEPKLLADIHLQRGVALLPLDLGRARRALAESFGLSLRPRRNLRGLSPKVREELDRAAAARRPLPDLLPSDVRRIAAVLKVSALVVISTGGPRGSPEWRTGLLLVDLPGGRARRVELRWAPAASRADVSGRVRREVEPFLPPRRHTARRRRLRRIGIWSSAGMAVASIAAGAALLALSRQRFDEAGGLANQSPQVEYYPRVYDLEQSGQRLQGGAIGLLVVGGASVAAGLALILWRPDRLAGPVRLDLGPGSFRIAF